MKKLAIVTFTLATIAILLPLASAQAAKYVVEFPVVEKGHIVMHEWQDPTSPEGPVFELNSGSTPNWGLNNFYDAEQDDYFVSEWRAYLGFDFGNWLRPGTRVVWAQLYYGGTSFVTGGPGLPDYCALDIYAGQADPAALTESDWDAGEFGGHHQFPPYPGPGWIALNSNFIAALNASSSGVSVVLRDASHASEDGFYGSIASRCILKLWISVPGGTHYDIHESKAMSDESMTFGQVKELYR